MLSPSVTRRLIIKVAGRGADQRRTRARTRLADLNNRVQIALPVHDTTAD